MKNQDVPSVRHELKRYLTHLQSHMFMVKASYAKGDIEQAEICIRKHEQTIQLVSQLIDKHL